VPDPSDDQLEDWETDPRGMMEYYQNQKYSLGQSIADLVDNCYDAGASKIDVTVGLEGEQTYVRILDDGKGMTLNQLKKAMKLGVEQERSDDDLGVFGIGMKLSSLAQANQVTIQSVKNSQNSIRRIDATWIKENNENKIVKFSLPNSIVYEKSYQLFVDGKWSTMVLLEDLHGEKRFRTFDKSHMDALELELKKVRVHLGLTFQRIIETRSQTTLSLNGSPIEPLNPSMPWEDAPRFGTVHLDKRLGVKTEDGSKISVNVGFVIIPHSPNFKESRRSKKMHDGYKKANDMQGLYLYRNDRLIEYGSWHGLFGLTNDEHDKCAKILIDIPSQHSSWFGMNPTKTDMSLPGEFMRILSNESGINRRWGAIKNGKEVPFLTAATYRYDNEGKKAKKAATGKKAKTATSGDKDGGRTPVPPPPSGRKRAPKPKPVIVSMEEKEGKTIAVMDKTKPGYRDLIRILRLWKG
jgi:hypothetical protein